METKSIDEFGRDKYRPNGRRRTCKPCAVLQTRAYRVQNPGKRREHYERNKERVLAEAAVYRATHKAEERAARRAHYVRNRDHNAKTTKAYREANRSLYNAAYARRKARKLQATPAWADETEMSVMYRLATDLTELWGQPFEVDHVVPLQGRTVCGLHVHTNLSVVPREDNRRKSRFRWPDMP